MSVNLKRVAARVNRHLVVQGLGWFSVGLGLAELFAPRKVSRLCGIPYRPLLMRVLGLRELASGVGILSRQQPGFWLKSRVAGDTMDLSLLGASLFAEEAKPSRLAFATCAVAGVTALDMVSSMDAGNGASPSGAGADHFKRSIIINRSSEELYNLWRNFEQLPQFMQHLISVQTIGEGRSRWVAKGPAGTQLQWDAEIINDKPSELIAWRSLPGGDVDHVGSVRFQPARGGRGTLVRVEMQYRVPAGAAGAAIAKFLAQSPEKQVDVDLRRFKQWVETGEVARTEGQSAGRARSTSMKYDDLVRA
jgi:uncharacterized membrane protein